MLALFREGFWRDVLALVVAAVFLAGLAAGGVARGVEAYFTQAVSGLVGAPGEFDAIVHLRRDAGAEGLRLLGERLTTKYPGYVQKKGPELAGYLNVLVRLPDERRTRAGFESLKAAIEDVPGFDGITYIVEPAIVASDVHPSLQQDFIARASVSAASCSFSSGSSVWAVLHSPDHAEEVQRALQAFASSRAVIDLRLPVGPRPPKCARPSPGTSSSNLNRAIPNSTCRSSRRIPRRRAGGRPVGRSPGDLGAQRDRYRPASLSPFRGRRHDRGRCRAASSRIIISLMCSTPSARRWISSNSSRLRLADVSEQLRGAAEQGEASDALIALLIQRLIDRLCGGGEVEVPRSAVDVGELRSGITAIAERIQTLEQLDPGRLASSLREPASALPASRMTKRR